MLGTAEAREIGREELVELEEVLADREMGEALREGDRVAVWDVGESEHGFPFCLRLALDWYRLPGKGVEVLADENAVRAWLAKLAESEEPLWLLAGKRDKAINSLEGWEAEELYKGREVLVFRLQHKSAGFGE